MIDLSPMAEEAALFFDCLPRDLRRAIGAMTWEDLHPFVKDDIMRALISVYDIPENRTYYYGEE